MSRYSTALKIEVVCNYLARQNSLAGLNEKREGC